MADQYWVLPVGGLEWGQTASGTPVTQLPDTSGMVEIRVNATVARSCPDPAPGEDQRCYIEDASVGFYVVSPGGSAESYIDQAFVVSVSADDEGAAFTVDRTVIDINFNWMGFPYRSPVIVPPAGRLYVAFESPATAGELHTVSVGSTGDWALRLDVDTLQPRKPLSPINFRMFVASGTQPEFRTAFVNAAEIV